MIQTLRGDVHDVQGIQLKANYLSLSLLMCSALTELSNYMYFDNGTQCQQLHVFQLRIEGRRFIA